MQITNNLGTFDIKDLCGYAGVEHPHLLREAFSLWGDDFDEFKIVGDGVDPPPPQVMLFKYMRTLLGKDSENYAQLCGDCTSFMAKNCVEYAQAFPILNGVRDVFRPIDTCYIYGTGRVQIGGTRLGLTDGGLGVWMAKAVTQYGAIPRDLDGVPEYSASRARQWGRGQGPPDQFITEGKQHLIKSAAPCNNIQDATTALKNGYPVGVCSDQGFSMTASSDGFYHPSGHWSHAMAFVGIDTGEGGFPPCVCLLNSWGDTFGQIKDFRDPTMTWPIGTLRITLDVADSMLKAGDSFVYSTYDGYPAQPIPRSIFDIWS